jgi:rhodanese-related sulfurtransferase
MRNGKRIDPKFYSIILLLSFGVSYAMHVHAGHGVEDTVESVTPERAKQLLDAGEKLFFIDLRPVKEFQQNRLPGARSIPIAELANRYNEIPKSGRVILYCECKPYDVADRAVFLEYRGYRNIFIMPEGYSGWTKRGYPLETKRP